MSVQDDKATFAGGCFWCMVKPFDDYPGVKRVIAGYTGGNTPDPTYEQVCRGGTGHTEAVEITYSPDKISYEDLLCLFWQQIDPTDAAGQFADRGDTYRPVIFYHSPAQKLAAEASKQALIDSHTYDKAIAVAIEPAKTFYPAETYHQQFYKKQPSHYNNYFQGSGRADFIKRHHGGKFDE